MITYSDSAASRRLQELASQWDAPIVGYCTEPLLWETDRDGGYSGGHMRYVGHDQHWLHASLCASVCGTELREGSLKTDLLGLFPVKVTTLDLRIRLLLLAQVTPVFQRNFAKNPKIGVSCLVAPPALSDQMDVFPPWFPHRHSPDSNWMAGHQLVLETASQLQDTYCSYPEWLPILKDQISSKNSRSETSIENHRLRQHCYSVTTLLDNL